MMKSINVACLFESYGDLYQPYIPPVINALDRVEGLRIAIDAFQGTSNGDFNVLPSYRDRKIKKAFQTLTSKKYKDLNYIEINYLKKDIDIIHIQHSYLHRKFKGLLNMPREKRPKVVITLRGADTYMKPWVDNSWVEFYNTFGQHVDAFITMSEHQKAYMKKWNVDENKIHVIPISYGNPFNVTPKLPNKDEIRLISAFRLCWEKNIEGNLRVAKNLVEQGYKINYNIFGSGNDKYQVPYLIDKYNLKDAVTFHGKVENSKLKEWMKTSDFYLQLSHSESLGMSIIEGQTHGLPAIVSDSDGLPEVINHGKSGFCVKPYAIDEAVKCILELWKAPGKYNAFSEAAISFSQNKFSIQNEVGRLENLYRSLLA